jgi:hypothetical protein
MSLLLDATGYRAMLRDSKAETTEGRLLQQGGRPMKADDSAEDPPGWGDACRREAAIRDMLDRHPGCLTINAVESVAWELGLSRPTRYRLTRTVEGLLEHGRIGLSRGIPARSDI